MVMEILNVVIDFSGTIEDGFNASKKVLLLGHLHHSLHTFSFTL